jgi:hypothetical protein
MPHLQSCPALPILPKDIQQINFGLADFCIDTRWALHISPRKVKSAARCVYKTNRRRLYHQRLSKQRRRHNSPVVLYYAKQSNFFLEVFLLYSSCVACTVKSHSVYTATFFHHGNRLHCHGDGVWQELMEFQKRPPSEKRIDDFETEIEDYLRRLPIDNKSPCPNDCRWFDYCEFCDSGSFMDTQQKADIVETLIGDVVSKRLCLALAQNTTIHAPRAQRWQTSGDYRNQWLVHLYLLRLSHPVTPLSLFSG